ncbi:helix-turn-helix domain-containing protein [Lacrimispora sp.]|uniref:helix-turn-helix domain-containing protein n=1 Tax=Lacrimispora sp. TaxID=2719234 RepID=UPI0034604392
MYQKYADLRDKASVTDYEVAKQTGVSTATLTNWKYGRYNPKADKLMALSEYFGVPMEYFYEKTEKEEDH